VMSETTLSAFSLFMSLTRILAPRLAKRRA
jgi:hypothetical protein